MEKIREYISKAKKKGHNPNEIKESLMNAGWPDNLVKKEFKNYIKNKNK